MTEKPRATGHVKLERLFLRKAEFEQVVLTPVGADRSGNVPVDDLDMEVSLGWNEQEGNRVDVELQFGVEPNPEKRQPYRVKVSMFGTFSFGILPQGLTKESFARRNAAAIMLPYLREAVSNLTLRGSAGPLILPPVNVVAWLDRAELEKADANGAPARSA